MLRRMTTRRIVLGLDGSEGAAAARDWCAVYAPLLDAEVVAVHVIDLSPLYFGPATIAALQPPIAEVKAAGQQHLVEWAAPLGDAGVTYRTELVEGRPAPVLERVAAAEDADLVVVGRRGQGGVAELVLGSVPHALAHHCARSLVVVPAPHDT
jgi:nucleotide-binding universal stress UspA family protein